LPDLDQAGVLDIVGGDDGLDGAVEALGDAVQGIPRLDDIDRRLRRRLLGQGGSSPQKEQAQDGKE